MNNPKSAPASAGLNFNQISLLLLGALVTGALVGLVFLNRLAPGMLASVSGEQPKVYWYLARGSALTAFGLLWLSMALGVSVTNRMARLWPGGPQAVDLHEYISLLGLAFGVFHGLILLGDRYIGFTLSQVLMPFTVSGYHPFWVGLGQLGIYLWAIIAVSFYLRKQIGQRTWRVIHFATYAVFGMTLLHGLTSGADSGAVMVQALYWLAGGSLLFLTAYRILAAVTTNKRPARTA